jgi:hypothetical protein
MFVVVFCPQNSTKPDGLWGLINDCDVLLWISMGIHMICIDAKYTTTLYWIQRVDIVFCVLDTVKTALNSNVCNYCTVVCNSWYE